uniref:Uncharacterized protein n=1 Tax=uncultured prokaryote TaxID=198431 RepID=A0A0H5Q3H8_9ZZZZ|nr:hypothetical protein [uncultured prokaryote]
MESLLNDDPLLLLLIALLSPSPASVVRHWILFVVGSEPRSSTADTEPGPTTSQLVEQPSPITSTDSTPGSQPQISDVQAGHPPSGQSS